ncbi:MAG: hypothetical protein NTX64_16585, partial [Elusimicrobia bacterium]|nr:hypothetical protein [Elusimicrobiota bacterium]
MEETLARWRGPVDSFGVGPKVAARSLAFAELRTPDFVFLHSRFPVHVALEASELQGSEVELKLWKGAALVDSEKLPVRGEFQVLTATVTAEAAELGEERFRLEAAVSGAGAKAGARAARTSRSFGV